MENKSLRALAIFIIIGFVFIVNFAFFGVQGRITEDWTDTKLELPKIVMAGGNTSNGNAAMDAMGLKMVSDLVDKMSN